MAPAAECSLFPALHQRYVAVAVGSLDQLGTRRRCCPTASEPWALTARQGLLCSVSLGKIYVEKMSTPFRVTQVSRGSRNGSKPAWQSSIPVHEVLSLFHGSRSLQGRGIFPLLTTFIFYLLDPGNSFFFPLFFFKEKLQLICFNLQLRSTQQFHVMFR